MCLLYTLHKIYLFLKLIEIDRISAIYDIQLSNELYQLLERDSYIYIYFIYQGTKPKNNMGLGLHAQKNRVGR